MHFYSSTLDCIAFCIVSSLPWKTLHRRHLFELKLLVLIGQETLQAVIHLILLASEIYTET